MSTSRDTTSESGPVWREEFQACLDGICPTTWVSVSADGIGVQCKHGWLSHVVDQNYTVRNGEEWIMNRYREDHDASN